jgi:hypothetical protein
MVKILILDYTKSYLRDVHYIVKYIIYNTFDEAGCFFMNSIQKNKIMIIETNKQHLDVLYPQVIFFLDSGYHVTIVVNHETMKVDLIQSLVTRVKIIVKRNIENDYAFFKRLSRLVKEYNIQLIIFNTLEYSNILLPFLLYMRRFRVARVVHNLEIIINTKNNCKKMFNNIFKRIIYILINKYITWNFCLNETLCQKAYDMGVKCVDYFYPVFFTPFFKTIKNNTKNKSVVYFGVQGGVWSSRKNYEGLLKAVIKLKKQERNRIKIFIIGDINTLYGKIFISELKRMGIEEYFVWYNKHLSYEEYFNIINNMDYLMPLIDKTIDNYEKYNSYSISSTVSFALAFKKPLINSTDFKLLKKYNNFTVYYDGDNIADGLRRAIKIYYSHNYWKLKGEYYNITETDYNIQKRRYIDRIERLIALYQ